jgi:hypothetical protein
MRNVSEETCRENHNTSFILKKFLECNTVYEAMWKNIVEPSRLQMTIWRLRIAHWVSKAANAHSSFVTFIEFYV